jgi:hypothetical protein
VARGFFIVLKLAGTIHGLGWAIREILKNINNTLVKTNFRLFIISHFKIITKYKKY